MDQTLPVPVPARLAPELEPEIQRLARRYRRANGPVMSAVTRLGGNLEQQMSAIPASVRDRIEAATARALAASYGLAGQGARLPDAGRQGPLLAAMASGAAGGLGGLATSLAELPVSITVILHAIRREAVAAGFDPEDDWIKAECLQVFGAGSPLKGDDGINSAFLSARLTITGPAIQKIIATVAPRLATALGQKLAAQAVPVLGALAGAALNAAFLNYYREVAAVRFALLALAEVHGAEAVLSAFRKAATPPTITEA